MPDFGLFEASHIACPVMPQYHPKQLMEFLNSGKIKWVKAILAHLSRCIGGVDRSRSRSAGGSFNAEDGSRSPRGWSRSRTLSVNYGAGGQMTSSTSGGLSPGILTTHFLRFLALNVSLLAIFHFGLILKTICEITKFFTIGKLKSNDFTHFYFDRWESKLKYLSQVILKATFMYWQRSKISDHLKIN